ncbi:MAG: hypothetical protein HYV26_20530 [Candidatus Hydrogenedentes bacterium]|nr:hypothetical protein [Candidatus Hydrogenedentota bacterium]
MGKARRSIAKADLLVVNHHMLFSDMAIKREMGDFTALAVLPAYRRVIFDEAHSIEDSATEYLGISATLIGSLATLGRFQRMEYQRERGLFPTLRARLMKDCPMLRVDEYDQILKLTDEQLVPALRELRAQLKDAFQAIRELTAINCGQIGRDIKWRLTAEVLRAPAVRAVHNEFVLPAVQSARDFIRLGERLLRELQKIPPAPDADEPPIATEIFQLSGYLGRVERIANALAECTSEELLPNTVRWVEIDSHAENTVRVARCPLEVGKPLSEWLYENLKTLVMTSATLAVEGQFRYLFSRLGLDLTDMGRIEAVSLDTPFDFEKQALLAITTDVPNPTDDAFREDSIECLRAALEISRGHAFVLFTSFSSLEHAYRRLANELRAKGITPLQQGEAARTQLLERFRTNPSSVLFATDSFWEGVDVAGEALQCVILPKLPFRVPTEPILEARAEAIEAGGGNAFMEYSVPQAVIKFRQGFGRLIRRRTDRGVVLILDRRVLTRRYGRAFLNSLPAIRVVRGPKRGVFLALTEFFNPSTEE